MSLPLDWLSRLLEITPVHGQLDLRCQYGAPWRIDQEASAVGEMPYHVVLDGEAWLEGPAGKPMESIRAGDILLLAYGDAHTLHDGSGARPKPATDRMAANLTYKQNTGKGARLDMLCGRFVLAPSHARLLRRYLPMRLVVRSSSGAISADGVRAGAQLSELMDLMRRETGLDGLGGRAMLNALSAALFALTLRFSSTSLEAPPGLLALAGFPRLAPALDALFHDPGHPWTLPLLAKRCNMSRATFVRLFHEKLGRSASDLLTDVRMMLAANELRKPTVSTGVVAETVGYQSEAAFQRAFKLHMGTTPARWRRMAQTQAEVQ
jgi:AraC family transcriptional regulator, activator of mtrCDE